MLCPTAAFGDASPQPPPPQATSAEASTQDNTPASQAPSLPVHQYQLENGLTVLLSEDHQVPAVAVELVYLVGSGHERAGRTGFAHLFEHLMFQGSLHYDHEYFTPYEPIGAEVNGTTNQDRTNYYQQVPSQYAELPLWLESDRMRSLPDVLTKAKLDNQRDVVKNERRQRYEIAPYGMAFWHLYDALYPSGHPYKHSTIGSHEDLTAATLGDVKSFFEQYYVPRNAALVVVGDFSSKKMESMIEKYFGDIDGGQRATPPKTTRPVLKQDVHWVIEDQIELPRVYYAWHTPALFEDGDAELDLLSSILADGKSSRLFHSLVYEKKLAKDVSAFQISQKQSGMYVVVATAAPGTDLKELTETLEAELSRSLAKPITDEELERARNAYKKDFFGRMETYSSRASLLGSYYLFTGKGDYTQQDYQRYLDATASGVQAAGQRFLRDQHFVRLDFVVGDKSAPVRRIEQAATTDKEATSAKATPQEEK